MNTSNTTAPTTQDIPIADIQTADLQARFETDETTIGEYSESWLEQIKSDEIKFPPVIVFYDGTHYFLADGFHRYEGAKLGGLKYINAEVCNGTKNEAIWYAAGANQAHGLRRTNADKRRAVEIALRQKPDIANREIARHCGVGHPLVQEVRVQLEEQKVEPVPIPEKRIGADGRKRSAPVRKSVPPPPVPVKKQLEGIPVEPVPVPTKKSLPPPEPSAEMLDRTGYPIPEEIKAEWQEAETVESMIDELNRIKRMAKKWQDGEVPLAFAGVPAQSLYSHLSQAILDLTMIIPHAVCTTCQGLQRDTCELCHKRGFLSKFQFDNLPPEETRNFRAASAEKRKNGK